MIRTTGLMEKQAMQHTEHQGHSQDRLPCQRLIFTQNHSSLCPEQSFSDTPPCPSPLPHTHTPIPVEADVFGPQSSTDPLSPEDLPRTPLSQFPHLPSHARWKLSLFTALPSPQRPWIWD